MDDFASPFVRIGAHLINIDQVSYIRLAVTTEPNLVIFGTTDRPLTLALQGSDAEELHRLAEALVSAKSAGDDFEFHLPN